MKIGDRVFIHGYVDEIRKETVIIRNKGGYFGTDKSEVIVSAKDMEPVVRCKDCKQRRVEGDCTRYYYCDFMGSMCGDNEYCSFGERREP